MQCGEANVTQCHVTVILFTSNYAAAEASDLTSIITVISISITTHILSDKEAV